MGGWGEGTSPLPMSTQAFVNEMITTVTVAQSSANYQYSSIFGLGYETLVSYYTLEVLRKYDLSSSKQQAASSKLQAAAPAMVVHGQCMCSAWAVHEHACCSTDELSVAR